MADDVSSRAAITTDAAGWTRVEYGPMRLDIHATTRGRYDAGLVEAAARASLAYLDRLALYRQRLARPVKRPGTAWPGDALVERMVKCVEAVGDDDLTPMAAVAGTVADAVADGLFGRGMTRVIVNNGGDIAVRLEQGEHVRVGVRSDLRCATLSHTLRLDGRTSSWGVATSGFGGRSFTRGIASAVSVVGENAAMADAAATAVANACMTEDERILQMPAEVIDPNTDLVGIPVTISIGPLPETGFRRAIDRALAKAEQLSSRGIIVGALIAAGGMVAVTGGMASRCSLEGR